jgi:hypothetical protein
MANHPLNHTPRIPSKALRALDALSIELLDMILSYLDQSPSDLLAFGLTCERFWALGDTQPEAERNPAHKDSLVQLSVY